LIYISSVPVLIISAFVNTSHVSLFLSKDESVKIVEDETNNALERYNRTLSENIPEHPDLLSFVKLLKDEAVGIVQRMDEIRKGQEKRQHEEGAFSVNRQNTIPNIPIDYETYVPPEDVEEDEKEKKKANEKGK